MADLDFVKNDHGEDLRDTKYFSGLHAFWDLGNHEIPAKAGAYILLARGTRFQYPIGKNAVYYIGQSTSLHRRLHTHWKRANDARRRECRQGTRDWPRYEYAASFGTHYCYVKVWGPLKPRALEEILMGHFLMQHRSFPVANGAGSWSRIDKYIKQHRAAFDGR